MLAGLLLAVGSACSNQEAADQAAGTSAELPEWLNRVYPSPGSEGSATTAIQADFARTGPDQNVRLLVDGTDVTTYATIQRGELHYDPDDGRTLVELDPGRHSAAVELVTDPPYGQRHEVIDRFEWQFTIR